MKYQIMTINILKMGFHLMLISLFAACQGDDLISFSNCGNVDLETISDNKSCSEDNLFLVCEVVEATDLIAFEKEDFDWIPMLCNDIGQKIEYKNPSGETFDLTISHKDHYINKERTYASCDISIEHASYICQRNETALIEFKTPFFGQNLTRFKLFKQISEVKDGVLGKPKLYFTLGQPRFGTNVYNFLHRVEVEAKREHKSQLFPESKMLNGKEYNDVYEFLIRETFHSDPHLRIYVNKTEGILGFNKDNQVWLKQN